jgi:sugar/nucleoside kinase (ribokinase family)
VIHIQAVKVPPPIDTVGAGDTFVAALAACLAGGASEFEAGMVATLASAVTIKILRMTGTASPSTILKEYDLLVGQSYE